MKKLLLVSLLVITLSGCAAAVVLGAAAAGGLIIYDKRDLITMQVDQSIKSKIDSAIDKDESFDNSHIVVSSFNQHVLLIGQTPQAPLRMRAEKIASNVMNVKRIYNEIVISSPSSVLTRNSDAVVTTKVKALMLKRPGLSSGQIKVITENGVVYLMGKVSHEQADMAVDVARRTTGVQKVTKVFTYTD